MNGYLCKMTKELQRRFFQDFANDSDSFADMERFLEYVYCEEDSDSHWERQQKLGRVHLAVMLEEEPIGEVILKEIDKANRSCTLSIHMKNDSVKNRGFGTRAENLTLKYAFEALGMETGICGRDPQEQTQPTCFGKGWVSENALRRNICVLPMR